MTTQQELSEVARLQKELDDLRAKVVTVAKRYAVQHDWCDVVDEALGEMGLRAEKIDVPIDISMQFTLTLRVDKYRWEQMSSVERIDAVEIALDSVVDPDWDTLFRLDTDTPGIHDMVGLQVDAMSVDGAAATGPIDKEAHLTQKYGVKVVRGYSGIQYVAVRSSQRASIKHMVEVEAWEGSGRSVLTVCQRIIERPLGWNSTDDLSVDVRTCFQCFDKTGVE